MPGTKKESILPYILVLVAAIIILIAVAFAMGWM
jgi:hypothetical protein